MKIAIPTERRADEARVAASPDMVKKLVARGVSVIIETGAGASALISDDAFREAGATIAPDAATAYDDAELVLKVRRPLTAADGCDEVAMMRRDAIMIGLLNPIADRDQVDQYAAHGLTAFAMELMPRISRAQAMDALSSQSNIAGYKAVIDAAAAYKRIFPMMMTAAGSIAPARVLVLGMRYKAEAGARRREVRIWPPAVARNTGSVRNSLPMRCTWKGIVAENMYESRCLGR